MSPELSLLDQLKTNKGTVSSALGKELANEVLAGNEKMLKEAIRYTSYDPDNIASKSIRAGAAKIVEKVAEKRPELVALHLAQLLPALEMPEPQTRWMIINTFGLCAASNPEDAYKGMEYAEAYLKEQNGVCLTGAANKYLGHMGAQSEETTSEVLPKLIHALSLAGTNDVDWILEAFIMMAKHLDPADRETVLNYANSYNDAPKKSTHKRIVKLRKLLQNQT